MRKLSESRNLLWSAFTLVELLVSVSIICVLAALLLGGVTKVREGGAKAKCTSNLRQFALAGRSYIAENNNLLPYRVGPIPDVEPSLNWMQNLAPYLQLSGTESQANVFLCPADPSKTPRQVRTYRYAAVTPGPLSTRYGRSNYIPYLMSEIDSPMNCPMLFCVAYTGPSLLPLFGYSEAIWTEDGENFPASVAKRYPRPHFNGKAVNVVFYDGHVAAIPVPVAPEYFHFASPD